MPSTQRAGSWTVGELLRAQGRRVPERTALGEVIVHFPRVGYTIKARKDTPWD